MSNSGMSVPRARKRPLEKTRQAEIIHALRLRGHFVEVNGVHKGGSTRRSGLGPGSPDLLVILKGTGVALFLEVKRDEKEKPTTLQEIWHRRAQAAGITCEVVWSVAMAERAVEAAHSKSKKPQE